MGIKKYYIIESVSSPGSFYAGESYGKFKGWLYVLKLDNLIEAEIHMTDAVKFGSCKIVEVYEE